MVYSKHNRILKIIEDFPNDANSIVSSNNQSDVYQIKQLKLSHSPSQLPTLNDQHNFQQIKPSTANSNSSLQSIAARTLDNQLPSKDSVIRKMKKITKAVQELFKATKENDFMLFVFKF
jgi:hypothetical protein